MKIEVKKLLALNKFEGGFTFEYLPPEDICIIPLCKLSGVRVSGDYEIYDDDSVGVNLRLEYVITGKCSYCLSDAETNIKYECEILFVPEKDGDNYFYDGFNINLETAVNDAILISQPNILLCKCCEADG